MKKTKINILRLVAFSLILCCVAVVVFSISEVLFGRLARAVGELSENTKNALWLIKHVENLTLLPVLALLCTLFYCKKWDDCELAMLYREKKLMMIILAIFLYFVFLPYFVFHNTAANVNVFEALSDKIIWFLTQLIVLVTFFAYYTDRENRYLKKAEENSKGEENEEEI